MIATLTSLKLNCCLQGLSNSARPFIWRKTWGVNWRALEGVAYKAYENGLQKVVFSLFLTFIRSLEKL